MRYSILLINLMLIPAVHLSCQSMEYFIETGIEQHAQIEMWQNLELAKEKESREVKAWPGPEVSVGYGLFPIETRVGPQIFRAGVSQMILWSGLLNTKEEIVKVEAHMLRAQKELSQEEIEFNIKSHYLELYRVYKKNQYLKAFTNVYEEVRTDRIRQMESGMGHYSDVLLIERSLQEIEQQVKKLEDNWRMQLEYLSYWSGLPELDTIELTTLFPPFDPRRPASAQISDYPALKLLEQKKESKLHAQDLNEWNSYPQLMVGLDYMVNAARQGVDIPDNGRDAVMPKLSVSLPFLSRRYDYANERLKAEILATEAEKRNTELQIQTEIEAARYRQYEAYTEYQTFQGLIDKTEQIIDITKAQIGADHTRFVQFWDYQKEIVSYRLKQLDAQLELYRQEFIIEKYTQ